MFTCLSCQVAFIEPEYQREHFHSDWHRYNLKRKVAELPPVSAETFKERVLAQKAKTEEEELKSVYCEYCKKVFANEKSFQNHVKSKKHLEKVQFKKETKLEIENGKNLKKGKQASEHEEVEDDDDDDDEDMEVEEVDSDEWEGDPVPVVNCLFCSHESRSIEKNLKHMTVVHSFFIPDLQYCNDLHGLVAYLGEKIGCGMECLWCNEKSKHFWTVDAVQRHMRDKGHCMMKLEGETLLEYSNFYDYSSSYPDADYPNVNPEEEIEPGRLINDGYELTLPSGATIGHRSLLIYYKQRLKPNRSLVLHKNSSGSIYGRVMSHYQALGWNGTTKADITKKARDMQFMRRIQSKQWMRLGVKANKLQTHFRPQVLF